MNLAAQAWQHAKEVFAGSGFHWCGLIGGRDFWFKWPNSFSLARPGEQSSYIAAVDVPDQVVVHVGEDSAPASTGGQR